jgi:3-oxoacyl-[acyl-carrier-protein] synthase II
MVLPHPAFMSQERVVITGVGAVTPMGCTRREIAARLRRCQSALTQHDFGHEVMCHFGQVTPDVHEVGRGTLDWLDEEERALLTVDNGILFGFTALREALNEAGLALDSLDPWRVATIVSASKGQFRCLRLASDMLQEIGPRPPSEAQRRRMGQLVLNYPGDTLGRLIARRYGLSGPVLNYPAACATGIFSLVSGAHLLLEDRADVVLAGSAESTGNASTLASFINMGAISPDLARPFDKRRGGFNPGEGAAVFILERESDARARGATIRGVLSGWDTRSDAFHITGVDTEGTVVEYAMRACLERTRWDPATVGYINAHGTGTELNDATEAAVIERIFGQPGPWVSSLKSTVGHLLGASASVELAMTCIALDDGFLPPTVMLEEPDESFHCKFVPSQGTEEKIMRFMKNSLGFGGHIGVLAVERCD